MNLPANLISRSTYFRLAELLIAGALSIAIFAAWQSDRRNRAQLSADLAAANQSLAQATARQHDRDTQLQQTLASLAAAKRANTTPQQILRDLPSHLPLPIPITVTPSTCRGTGHPWPPEATSLTNESSPQSSRSNPTQPPISAAGPLVPPPNDESPNAATDSPLTLPAADLRPLYDFALDCQACQAKLSAAQSDLADERTKSATLTRERDEAIHTAKGGTTFRRLTRAAKWFVLGAAAGAIAATAHH